MRKQGERSGPSPLKLKPSASRAASFAQMRVAGGPVVIEALLRAGVEVHAEGLVHGVAVPEPGLVVAEDYEHDGLIALAQLVDEPGEALLRVYDGAEVVRENIARLFVEAAVDYVVVGFAPLALLAAVGPVPLIGDGEGELRRIAPEPF